MENDLTKGERHYKPINYLISFAIVLFLSVTSYSYFTYKKLQANNLSENVLSNQRINDHLPNVIIYLWQFK